MVPRTFSSADARADWQGSEPKQLRGVEGIMVLLLELESDTDIIYIYIYL